MAVTSEEHKQWRFDIQNKMSILFINMNENYIKIDLLCSWEKKYSLEQHCSILWLNSVGYISRAPYLGASMSS